MTREQLKQRILNEMVRGAFESDREEMLLEVIKEYPHLNNPEDRERFRNLYTKLRSEIEHNKGYEVNQK